MSALAHRRALGLLRREPALLAMELLWRWSFGLGVLALAFIAYAQLHPALVLPDSTLPPGSDPYGFAQMLALTLADAMPLIVRTIAELAAPAAVLWIAACTLGRGLIIRLILGRMGAASAARIVPQAKPALWIQLAMVSFARVLMLLIPVSGYLGGAWLATVVDPAGEHLATSLLIVLASLFAALALWSWVRWILSLAPILLVRNGFSALDAIVGALQLARLRRRELLRIAVWNASVRTTIAVGFSVAGLLTVVFPGPAFVVLALLALESILWLVIDDALQLAALVANCEVAVMGNGVAESGIPIDSTPSQQL